MLLCGNSSDAGYVPPTLPGPPHPARGISFQCFLFTPLMPGTARPFPGSLPCRVSGRCPPTPTGIQLGEVKRRGLTSAGRADRMLKRGPRKHCRAPHQSNPGSIPFPRPPWWHLPLPVFAFSVLTSIRLRASMASPGSLDSPPGQAGCVPRDAQ